jgi:hypothetical protein
MAVTVVVGPTSPRATADFCTITVAGAVQNDTTAYTTATYLSIEKSSVVKGRSYVFAVDENGGHVFPNYVFPDAGTYVVHLRKSNGDASAGNSGNITVQ